MIIDTHSHLFSEEFTTDLPATIERAKEVGVSHIIMPNIDVASLPPLLNSCKQFPGYCYPTLGLHPTSVNEQYREELKQLKEYLKPAHPFVAIGEVGLDFYWDTTYACEQIAAFEEQIRWAIEYQLPLVIHCRNAYQALYDSLSKFKSEPLRGIFHCFAGTEEDAKRLLEFKHFLFGINGSITYKKSSLPEVFERCIPLTKVVVETDSPYLSPVPYRGKRNETAYITEVIKKVATIYHTNNELVEDTTSKNALDIFTLRQSAYIIQNE